MYVHAHLRYIEALARIGRPDGVPCPDDDRRSCSTVTSRRRCRGRATPTSAAGTRPSPIVGRRPATSDVFEAGAVAVKGGWRIYSSGPGIYLNQLISNILGLRSCFDEVVIDPVLPRHADGLTFDFEFDGRPVQYRYHVRGDGFGPTEVLLNGASIHGRRATDNPYRVGGMLIDKAAFRAALDRAENIVDITV